MKIFGIEIGRKRLEQMAHPRQARLSELLLPNTKHDYAGAVGDGLGSSVIIAPVLWMARTFPEAPLAMYRVRPEANERVLQHDLLTRLSRPNPFYSGHTLWMATVTSYAIDGNAYWGKVRDARGAVQELWYIPHWLIKPAINEGSTAFIDYYEYRVGGQTLKLDPSDVVHFRFGLDPRNPRRGMSPLQSVLREVFTDDEAANFTGSLLRNLGVPGLLISPAEGSSVNVADLREAKVDLERKFGGDNRGKPIVLSGPTKLEQFGFSPQQLDLKALRRIPEERVTAVLGIPAVVAGLGAGLDRSTFANMAEAREAAVESNIIPTQRLMAADIMAQLLPDFEPQPEQWLLEFDTSKIRALQQDENALAERWATLYQAAIVTRGEARAAMGLTATDADNVYFGQQPAPLIEQRSVKKNLSEDELTKRWRDVDSKREPYIERAEAEIRALFEAQLSAIEAEPEAWERILDEGQESLEAYLRQLYLGVAPVFAADAIAEIEALGKAGWLDAVRGWLSNLVGGIAGRKSQQITETTKQAMQEAIRAQDPNSGREGILEVARNVLRRPDRPALIAETEVVAASNLGRHGAGVNAPVVLEKIWLSMRDDRVRDAHRAADGLRIPVDEPFLVGGERLMYPGDASLGATAKNLIRCRCTLYHAEA